MRQVGLILFLGLVGCGESVVATETSNELEEEEYCHQHDSNCDGEFELDYENHGQCGRIRGSGGTGINSSPITCDGTWEGWLEYPNIPWCGEYGAWVIRCNGPEDPNRPGHCTPQTELRQQTCH